MSKKGWARRAGGESGKLYGKKYIHKYKADIQQFFNEGKKNSSKKMNPAIMLQRLKINYPNKFSLPGETEIKQEIGALFKKSKNESIEEDDGSESQEPRDRESWKKDLNEIVKNNKTGKPEYLYKIFIERMESESIIYDAMPNKKEMKTKISTFKTKFKNKAMKSIL